MKWVMLDGTLALGVANMEKFFVLMAAGFDYNDEYYTRTDFGSPEKVFTDREKAEAAAKKEGLDEFKRILKDGYLRDYSYDGLNGLLADSVTDEDVMYEDGIFMTLFGLSAEDWYEAGYSRGYGREKPDGNLIVEPTDEQWEKLYSCFNLSFYDVVEVQKG